MDVKEIIDWLEIHAKDYAIAWNLKITEKGISMKERGGMTHTGEEATPLKELIACYNVSYMS